MPTIASFYGEFEASFTINDGEIMNGTFPKNGKRLVMTKFLLYTTK
jgi:hypothetical protein